MGALTDETMEAALRVVRDAGIAVKLDQRGSRVTAEITRDGVTRKTLVKIASIGNAMVNADIDDADGASLRALEGVNDVLFAIGLPGSDIVQAFLVPVETVEKAYRDTHRRWRDTHAEKNENTTWVLPFGPTKDPALGGFAEKWSSYLVGQSRRGVGDPAQDVGPASSSESGEIRGLSVDEAKEGLSARFGVPVERIRIVIEH